MYRHKAIARPITKPRHLWFVAVFFAFVTSTACASEPETKIPLGEATTDQIAALSCPGQDANSTRFTQRSLDTGAVNLAFQEGPDNGPALVILPGMSVPAESYRVAASLLCDSFHIFVVTQRGHYNTGWASDGAYHVSDYGNDTVKLIDEVIGEPVIISGHSLGALVSLWIASEHPSKVIGFNAEDGPFLIQEAGRWHSSWVKPLFVGLEARGRAYHEDNASLDTITQMFAEDHLILPTATRNYEARIRALGKTLAHNAPPPGTPPLPEAAQARRDAALSQFLSGQAPTNGAFWPAQVLPLAAKSTLHLDPRVPAAAVDASLTEGFGHMEAFSKVRAPTLYWNSDQDMVGVISAADHASIVDTLRQNVKVEHVDAVGSGHRIHRDQPALFAARIKAFFLEP